MLKDEVVVKDPVSICAITPNRLDPSPTNDPVKDPVCLPIKDPVKDLVLLTKILLLNAVS